jgi:hypothetical protein
VPGLPAPAINLAASPSAPGEAGSFLVDTLRDPPPEQVELATRLTAEILEMIARHVIAPSGKTIRVTAGGGDDGLRVTIRERGPGLALGMASDRQADVSCRRLLDTTSSHWDFAHSITGTYLWFELEESAP